MSMYRFVICVDVEASSLEEGYSTLYDEMKKVDTETFQWESTNEVFDPSGGLINPMTVQAARIAKFDSEPEELDFCESCKEPFSNQSIDGGRCLSYGQMIT